MLQEETFDQRLKIYKYEEAEKIKQDSSNIRKTLLAVESVILQFINFVYIMHFLYI
jgi:hypothetical protein